MTLDLSAITDTLIGLIKDGWTASPIWTEIGGNPPGPTFTPTFTGLAPDAVRQGAGPQLSMYLYHVESDNAIESFQWRTAMLDVPSGSPTAVLPLALDLFYLLFAYSETDYVQEHEAMSVALRIFHANPIVRSASGVTTPWELTLTMEHRSYDELSRLWQATTAPLRMSLVYRAAVAFIDAETAPNDADPPESFTVAVGQIPAGAAVAPPSPPPRDGPAPEASQYPVVIGTERVATYTAPGGATVPLTSAPACVSAGQTVVLNGVRLGTAGTSDHVYLLPPGGAEIDVSAWATAAESTPSRYVLTLPSAAGAAPDGTPPPGVYQLRVGSGALGAAGSTRSNCTPFSIAAHVDATGGPVLSGAVPYTVSGAGFATGATEVFVGSDPLAATTAAPTGGQVNVAASGASFQFVPPAGGAGTTLPVRVRVNGIESDPTLWVTV